MLCISEEKSSEINYFIENVLRLSSSIKTEYYYALQRPLYPERKANIVVGDTTGLICVFPSMLKKYRRDRLFHQAMGLHVICWNGVLTERIIKDPYNYKYLIFQLVNSHSMVLIEKKK